MINIAEVIGWKFNNQAGMSTKEIDGVITIVDFPGGIPSQSDQDVWTSEYNTYLSGIGQQNLKASVKAEAQKRIIAIEANWNDINYVVKQLNALMVAVDFVFNIVSRADANGGLVALTQNDKAIASALQSKKTQIEAIRSASNLIEADIDAGTITDESGVVSSTRWP